MRRVRPSGDGSHSRRFAEVTQPDGTKLKVPVVKDAGTFFFVATEDGGWPSTYLACVLADIDSLEEGQFVELEEVAPGLSMGSLEVLQVIEQKLRISLDRSGKYAKFAQLKRMVLLAPVPSDEEVQAALNGLQEDASG